jgi:hypothetical protein
MFSRLWHQAWPVPPSTSPRSARVVVCTVDHPRCRDYRMGASTADTFPVNAAAGVRRRIPARTEFSSHPSDALRHRTSRRPVEPAAARSRTSAPSWLRRSRWWRRSRSRWVGLRPALPGFGRPDPVLALRRWLGHMPVASRGYCRGMKIGSFRSCETVATAGVLLGRRSVHAGVGTP